MSKKPTSEAVADFIAEHKRRLAAGEPAHVGHYAPDATEAQLGAAKAEKPKKKAKE